MVSRRALFSDIVKHLLRWYHRDSINVDVYQEITQLPRASRYRITIDPMTDTLTVGVLGADSTCLQYRHPSTFERQGQRFAEISAVALQLVRLVGPRHGALTLRQTHLYETLANYLTRLVSERSAFTLNVSSRTQGFRLGLALRTNLGGRTIENDGFDVPLQFSDDGTLAAYDEYTQFGEEVSSVFTQCFRQGKGHRNHLYLDSQDALEAIDHQRGTLTLIPGFRPFIAFTGLSRDYGQDLAGLAVKYPSGWLVLLHLPEGEQRYQCYHVPEAEGDGAMVTRGETFHEARLIQLLEPRVQATFTC